MWAPIVLPPSSASCPSPLGLRLDAPTNAGSMDWIRLNTLFFFIITIKKESVIFRFTYLCGLIRFVYIVCASQNICMCTYIYVHINITFYCQHKVNLMFITCTYSKVVEE